MCPRPSCLRVSAVGVLILVFSLGSVESGAVTSTRAQEPQKRTKTQKKDPNVEVGTPPDKPPPRPARMNLKYKILKRESDGHGRETSPDSTFVQDDRIQLKVTPSLAGYLYIIQSEGDKDGELIFPHSGIGGQNRLTAREYQVPAVDCDRKYKDDQGVCWLPIRSYTGRVWITVYFSPRQTGLPFTTMSGGKVSREDILKVRDLAPPVEEFGEYGRKVTAGRNGKGVAAGIELNHEAIAESTSPEHHPGSSTPGTTGPAGPGSTGPVTPGPVVIKPPPSLLWGKIEREFDNSMASGLRVTVLKVTENIGRVAFNPLDGVKLSETLNLDFYGNFDGYVYVLHVSSLGRASVVFPDSRNSKKIKAKSVASMKRLSLSINEKGVHTLQIIVSANRVGVFEEALGKAHGQLNQVSAAGQQSRELGFDCASSLNLFQGPHRSIALASDPSNQGAAIAVVLASQPGAGADLCRNWTAEQIKGDKIKDQEVAIFEFRFKQV